MKPLYLVSVIIPLITVVLTGCDVTSVPTLAAAAHPLPTSSSLTTLIPSRTPLPSPIPTSTPQPTSTPSPRPTSTEEPTQRHLRIFDELYELVLDQYLYPDYNGLNWPAWGEVYREQLAAGMTDAAFHVAMTELVSKLNDGHSTFQSPAAADVTDAAIRGRYQMVGIGVETAARPEHQTAVLLTVYPNSPAWKAGLRPHDSLITIDGQPILDGHPQLDGPAGSSVHLMVQTPGQLPRQVRVTRAKIGSPPPSVARRLESNGLVYVAIRTFWDRYTASLLRQQLGALGNAEPIEGMIIDLRINRGGSEHTLEGLLSLFADGTLGHFTRRDGERSLAVSGAEVKNSLTVPLVLLIGRETGSYAEIFAGVLQSIGRARLVGAVTGGNVETIWPHDFEDGSRVWIAEEGFRPLNGGDWERDGIVPDYYVPSDWADFTEETDAQLATAINLLLETK